MKLCKLKLQLQNHNCTQKQRQQFNIIVQQHNFLNINLTKDQIKFG